MTRQTLSPAWIDHLNAGFRILGIIKGLPRKGLVYDKRRHGKIIAYPDADEGGTISSIIFTSEYYVLFGGNLISWKARNKVRLQGLGLKQNT